MARYKYRRQAHPAPAQFGQQVDTRNSRKLPIEDNDIGLGGGIERAEQGVAIDKALDGKTMPRKLITDNFAILLVIFDDKDAGGTRIALLRVGHQAGAN